jgi:hypothetical protein
MSLAAQSIPDEPAPNPCEWCGLTIDRHRMVDNGDGPEFFCLDLSPDEMTLPELERREELRLQEQIAATIGRWEAMDEEVARRKAATAAREPVPYRTPQSTIDAFWYVVRLDDPDYLARWLALHSADAPHLHEIWGRICTTVAE